MASQGFSGTFIVYFKGNRDIFVIHFRKQGVYLYHWGILFQNNFREQWNLLMRNKAKK